MSDITPIGNLEKLTELDLRDTNVSELTALTQLPNLSKLLIYGDNLSDLSLIGELQNLNYLSVGGDGLSDLSPLAKLENLTELSIFSSSISDLSPIAQLDNLRELRIYSHSLSDFSAIGELTKLTYLYVYGDHLNDLSPFSQLEYLAILDVNTSPVIDLSLCRARRGLRARAGISGRSFFLRSAGGGRERGCGLCGDNASAAFAARAAGAARRQADPLRKALHRQRGRSARAHRHGARKRRFPHGSDVDALLPGVSADARMAAGGGNWRADLFERGDRLPIQGQRGEPSLRP